MNIRKSTDYSNLFAKMDILIQTKMPQIELYWNIGAEICSRPEKGAAVAASEYLHSTYPDIAGFSPRNVRRMREFYRTYQNNPSLAVEAMKIGWTQNIVILERCEAEEERRWYIQAVQQFRWSKQQLIKEITDLAHTKKSLDNTSEVCYNKRESSSNPEYTEERPSRDIVPSFAQSNAPENSAEAISRATDNDGLYMRRVSGNTTDNIYHPYSITSICKVGRREKAALNDKSVCRCHSPPKGELRLECDLFSQSSGLFSICCGRIEET